METRHQNSQTILPVAKLVSFLRLGTGVSHNMQRDHSVVLFTRPRAVADMSVYAPHRLPKNWF